MSTELRRGRLRVQFSSWLKLTDAQVAQFKPVIAARIQKTDAALAKGVARPEHALIGRNRLEGSRR